MTRLARGKGCLTGKVKYERRYDARRAARNLTHELGRMRPYRCRLCRWYHIGHPPEVEQMAAEIESIEAMEQEPEAEDRILRTLWPFNPSAFGIRVLTTVEEVTALPGLEEEAAVALVQYIGQGWGVLMVESDIPDQRKMLAILTQTVDRHVQSIQSDAGDQDGRSESEAGDD